MDIGAITKGFCKYVRGILSDSVLDGLNQEGHAASMHSVIMDLDSSLRAYFNEEHNRCMQGIMSDMAERDACAFAEKYRLDHPGERITIEITPRPYNVILS
ncbi:MAG: hypothetical protein LBT59_10215, partial [Clostridiales bacterium]|nr:hypothetical protein [Clostridiales bacterium]